jgi:HSP20 family protein
MSDLTFYRPKGSLLGRSIFDEIFNGDLFDFPAVARRTTQGYPVADMYNTEAGTILEFALAGFAKDDLSINVQPDKSSITVRAESSSEDGEQDDRRIARRSFQKTYVNYDNNLSLANASAEFVNGLLTITIPRKEELCPVAVEIK